MIRRGSGTGRLQKAVTRNALARLCRSAPVLLACSAALPGAATTAYAADEDFGAWFAVSATGKLPEELNNEQGSWRLWLDGALRFGDDASRFSQGILRGGAGYVLNSTWTAWGGVAYIRTEPPYASPSTDERRIWEQVSWNGAVNRLKLSSRTRLEQRFFSGGIDTGWRLRELAKFTRPLDTTDTWSLVLSDELFANLNTAKLTPNSTATAGLDRNRFFVGPGWNVSNRLRTEFGYLNQYIFRYSGPDKIDHILSANFAINF
jgi:hypothetical protein